jgi:hypothetical protein
MYYNIKNSNVNDFTAIIRISKGGKITFNNGILPGKLFFPAVIKLFLILNHILKLKGYKNMGFVLKKLIYFYFCGIKN